MVDEAVPREQWTEALLGPYCERRIAELVPGMEPVLLTVHNANDGNSLILQPIGLDQKICNLQIVRPRLDKLWRALLCTHEYAFAQQLSSQNGEDFDTAATRVLAVSEVLKASEIPCDTPFIQIQAERDGWQILKMGSHQFLTTILSVRSQPHPFAFAFYYSQVMDMEKTSSVLGSERGLRW
jgi:hypothetical protein